MAHNSGVKLVLKNIASLGVLQIANFVFPLITIPYVSRIIGPNGYGVINYAVAFIAYFTLLIGYGFDLTATRAIARNPNSHRNLNSTFSNVTTARIYLLLLSSVVFSVCLFIVPPLAEAKNVAIATFLACISLVVTPTFLFQGMQDLPFVAKINFVRGVILTLFVFFIVKVPTDYVWIPWSGTILSFVVSLILLRVAVKKYKIKFYFVPFSRVLRLLFQERIVFFSMVVINLYTTTNTVILGLFADATHVGYYTSSQRFPDIINGVLSIPIAQSLFPYIGKAFGESREQGIGAIRRIFPIVFYITLLASFLLFFLGPLGIHILFGTKFEASILPLKILAFMPFIVCISNIFGVQLMLNLGMDKLFFRITAFVSIIGLILNVFMSYFYGYVGTAVNCIIIEIIVTLTMYIFLRKNNIDIVNLEYFNPKTILSVTKQLLKAK